MVHFNPLSSSGTHLLALSAALTLFTTLPAGAQNSMVGDGFGGRLWYRPTNYTVGSYSAFSLCYSDPCDSSSNQLFGWGADLHGELGNGVGDVFSNEPVAIQDMDNLRYYSTGYWMGAIKNDASGWVWHDAEFPFPTQVISDAYFVDAAVGHVSFVKNDGTVWSMGANLVGAFGDGTTTDNFTAPVQMDAVTGAVRVACSFHTNFVLLSDSTVLAVGANNGGLLGDPSFTGDHRTSAAPVVGLIGIVDIKANSESAAALDRNGDVFCWGGGLQGGTGDGDLENDTLPQQVAGLSNIVALSGCTDGNFFLALDADRNCYLWGTVISTQAVDPTMIALSPILVASDVIDIMAGETMAYIVKADGSLWAFGESISVGGSIWLNLPDTDQNGLLIRRTDFTQIDPAQVNGGCAVVGTAALPGAACDGSGGTITVSHFGGAEPYLYDIGGAQQGGNTFTGLAAGNYTATVTDANGCITTATCTVDPDNAPPVVQVTNVTTCLDEGYALPSGNIVYEAGSYADTLVVSAGCDTVRVINLSALALPFFYLEDTICSAGTYTLPSGQLVFEAGEYYDTLAVAGECDHTYFIYLSVGPPAPAALIQALDTAIVQGESVDLFASGGISYLWSPATGLSCTDCPYPVASPLETTEYCVVVSDNNICASDTACIRIHVEPLCTADNIYVPNAFSPNASGKNDTQCVYGGECIASMAFTIYDRWGTKVFEATDVKTCWDGIYNEKAMDAAVFVYHLSATLTNGESVEKQGNITLVR